MAKAGDSDQKKKKKKRDEKSTEPRLKTDWRRAKWQQPTAITSRHE
jgi:hypothetical protein